MRKIILLAGCIFFAANSICSQKLVVIDRESFGLQYPSTWTIDTTDEDYDPDALFSLDSPGNNATSIMFMIFSLPIDADEMLDAQLNEIKNGLIKKPTAVTSFDSWGRYKGKGKLIHGKLLGVFKGSIKIFMYTDDNKSMLVMEQLYDSDLDKLEDELKSIADSFTFK